MFFFSRFGEITKLREISGFYESDSLSRCATFRCLSVIFVKWIPKRWWDDRKASKRRVQIKFSIFCLSSTYRRGSYPLFFQHSGYFMFHRYCILFWLCRYFYFFFQWNRSARKYFLYFFTVSKLATFDCPHLIAELTILNYVRIIFKIALHTLCSVEI